MSHILVPELLCSGVSRVNNIALIEPRLWKLSITCCRDSFTFYNTDPELISPPGRVSVAETSVLFWKRFQARARQRSEGRVTAKRPGKQAAGVCFTRSVFSAAEGSPGTACRKLRVSNCVHSNVKLCLH